MLEELRVWPVWGRAGREGSSESVAVTGKLLMGGGWVRRGIWNPGSWRELVIAAQVGRCCWHPLGGTEGTSGQGQLMSRPPLGFGISQP